MKIDGQVYVYEQEFWFRLCKKYIKNLVMKIQRWSKKNVAQCVFIDLERKTYEKVFINKLGNFVTKLDNKKKYVKII